MKFVYRYRDKRRIAISLWIVVILSITLHAVVYRQIKAKANEVDDSGLDEINTFQRVKVGSFNKAVNEKNAVEGEAQSTAHEEATRVDEADESDGVNPQDDTVFAGLTDVETIDEEEVPETFMEQAQSELSNMFATMNTATNEDDENATEFTDGTLHQDVPAGLNIANVNGRPLWFWDQDATVNENTFVIAFITDPATGKVVDKVVLRDGGVGADAKKGDGFFVGVTKHTNELYTVDIKFLSR